MKQLPTARYWVIAASAFMAAQLPAQEELEPTPSSRSLSFTNEVIVGASSSMDMQGLGEALGGVSASEIKDTFGCAYSVSQGVEISFETTYHSFFFDAEHEAAAPMMERLQSLENQVGIRWAVNEKWMAMGGVGLSWHNSGTQFNSHGVGLSSFAGVLRNFGPRFSVMAGLGFDSFAKNNHKVMPALGFRYVYSPEWTIALGIPETALTWTGCDFCNLSLVADGNFTTYYIRAQDVSGNEGTASVRDGKMEYQDLRVGLRAESKFSDTFSISVTVGYLFSRDFDFYESGYKLESDEGALYGTLGISAKF